MMTTLHSPSKLLRAKLGLAAAKQVKAKAKTEPQAEIKRPNRRRFVRAFVGAGLVDRIRSIRLVLLRIAIFPDRTDCWLA
jgi:hypothetical protein